jgi:metallo-beta-lactamase family protein
MTDAGRLQEEEAGYANRKRFSKHRPALPLFTEHDAERASERLRPVAFGHPTEIAPGVVASLAPAGHILGSATVSLTLAASGRRLFFSGDVGRAEHPILCPPRAPSAADVVVTESTYGNRQHGDPEDAIDALADAVSRTAERGGKVIIPAFAVDRTEVVLVALARLVADGRIPRLPVYADSPMALEVLGVYRRAIEARDEEVRGDGTDPFDLAGDLHEARTQAESRALNDLAYPSIILSASGMATGGRVLHHLARRLGDRRSTVVLVGYQAAGTRGRQLADGARAVKIHGRYVPVHADVVSIDGFSVHADADELVAWLGSSPERPDVAFVVHGEPEASEALRQRLGDELGWNAVVPRLDERVRLD